MTLSERLHEECLIQRANDAPASLVLFLARCGDECADLEERARARTEREIAPLRGAVAMLRLGARQMMSAFERGVSWGPADLRAASRMVTAAADQIDPPVRETAVVLAFLGGCRRPPVFLVGEVPR